MIAEQKKEQKKVIKLKDYDIKRFEPIKKVLLDKILEYDIAKNNNGIKSKSNTKTKKIIPLFIKSKTKKVFSRLYFLDENEKFIIKFFSFKNKVIEINSPIDLREILGEQKDSPISDDMSLDFENKEFKNNCMFYFTCFTSNREHNFAEQFFQIGSSGPQEENFAILAQTYPKYNLINKYNELIYFRHLQVKLFPLIDNKIDKIIQEITVFNKIYIRLNDAMKSSREKNSNINENNINNNSVENKKDQEIKPESSVKVKKGNKKKKNKAQKSDSEDEEQEERKTQTINDINIINSIEPSYKAPGENSKLTGNLFLFFF
jgi:hypothetical protein